MHPDLLETIADLTTLSANRVGHQRLPCQITPVITPRRIGVGCRTTFVYDQNSWWAARGAAGTSAAEAEASLWFSVLAGSK